MLSAEEFAQPVESIQKTQLSPPASLPREADINALRAAISGLAGSPGKNCGKFKVITLDVIVAGENWTVTSVADHDKPKGVLCHPGERSARRQLCGTRHIHKVDKG